MVKSGLGIESLRRVALTQMLETANSEGDRASVALWQELASRLAAARRRDYTPRPRTSSLKLVPEARDVSWVER